MIRKILLLTGFNISYEVCLVLQSEEHIPADLEIHIAQLSDRIF